MSNIAKLFSAELEGVDAQTIEVEVDLNVGLHAFSIVGLADKALTEARERVNSALKNSGMRPPNRENRKITINLAPADIRKTGSQYDLAIALGYLAATGQMAQFDCRDILFVGELALDGRVRPVSGALSIAEMGARKNFRALFLPHANAKEASAIAGIRIVPVQTLLGAIAIIEGKTGVGIIPPHASATTPTGNGIDIADIRGQHNAKRATVIAAAGGHNILLMGPPGTGKSMLAQSLAGILPHLSLSEKVEVTKIWSVAGLSSGGLASQRPFRAPHQSISLAALIGGKGLKPGEVSLAHRGVLFLDELPEFARNVLEALRGPLENGYVSVARARGSIRLPARFSLVAAMNPCPCGHHGDASGRCRCTMHEVLRYHKRISGPLLDRIDLQVAMSNPSLAELHSNVHEKAIDTAAIRTMIANARERQEHRMKTVGPGVFTNADLSSRDTEAAAKLDNTARIFLGSLEQRYLSTRGYYRLLKTARTIADLENRDSVGGEHLAEAWSYRLRDRLSTPVT